MKLKDMTEASGGGPSRQLGKVRWAKCSDLLIWRGNLWRAVVPVV